MTDRKMSNFEFGSLNYFLIRCFLIGFSFDIIINSLKQDSWIIPLLSFIPAIIIILISSRIINYKPNLNIIDKVYNLFNKKIAFIIVYLLTTIIFFMGLLNFLNLNNFIQSQFLNRTPLIAISIMFIITTFYIVSKGINTISRTSNIVFYISFVLFFLSFIGLLPVVKIDNIKPFFTASLPDYITALNSFYSFNILPVFLLTIIPKNIIKNPKIKSTLIISYIIACISVFFVIFETIATFGYELTKLYEFPTFFVLKHVVLTHLSTRLESILIIQLIFYLLIYNIISIYFIGNSINYLSNNKSKRLVYLITCILFVVCNIFISKYNYYLNGYVLTFIPIVVSIIESLIIFIIFIKIKMSKN